ncbi:cilia- and flagella-associated protein 57-like [Adelges cooleyi]|uniref:cilia- and flagella-associated protein 57-like n=1 Tax=Adelges cooleyi TaxID=133065 RepID=UPI00217F3DEF|nr:cilia- and flagella-associated protein 57-like [Adelges cooleyi]
MSPNIIPSLEPKFIFGLTTGLKGNCVFLNDDEILYPVSGVLVIHNITSHTQRYIHLIDSQKTITAMTLSFSKNVLAVAKKNEKLTISLYDLKAMNCLRTLSVPTDLKANSFICLQFSYDDSYLAALTGGPDYMMYYYNWENSKIESYVKATNPPNVMGPVTDMALNPNDNTIACFVGKGLFRLMTITDSVWRQYGFQKADNLDFTSVCWLNGDRILAGTVDGRIILVENGDLIAVYNAKTTLIFDPKIKVKAPLDVMPLPKKNGQSTDIRCCVPFKKGLVFVVGDSRVYYYKIESDQRFSKQNEFEKQNDKNLRELDDDRPMHYIEMLSLNPANDKIVCVTRRSQMFWAPLVESRDISLPSTYKFKPLGEDLHHGGIADLSTCKWKPIFMTCGKIDHTIRVWNYLNCSLILSQHYQEDIFSISLHPTGLYSIAAFTGKVEFQLVHMDGLKRWREFVVTSCNLTEFSTSGHMFALANQFDVDVYCSVTFEKRFTYKGHSNTISAIAWTVNDMKLLTCGKDGAIYEFNTRSGERDMDIVHPDTKYMDLAISKDTNRIFPASQDGRFKEINNQSITRDIDLSKGSLDALVLSKSDLMLFVAGKNGVVLSLMLPIMAEINYKQFNIHNKNITAMKLTIDDSILITCSEDGSICIWKVKHAEGKMTVLNDQFTYSDDILVNALDFKVKIETIEEVKMRVKELERESEYQMSELIKSNAKQLHELNYIHSQRIVELENKNTDLAKKHMADKSRLEMELNLLRDSHTLNLEQLEANYNVKLLLEYEKYDALKKQIFDNNLELEKGLKELETKKYMKIKEIENQFNTKIKEKQEAFLKMEAKFIEDKQIMSLSMQQMKEETEKAVLERKNYFIAKLKELKKINLSLRSELGSYKMKAKAASKEADDLSGLIGKYEDDVGKLKSMAKTQENTILELNKQIQNRDSIIEQREASIYEEKDTQ